MKMENDDKVKTLENINTKMGASNNPNAARYAALKERKQSLEEKLASLNQELKKLCIQEAEFTGQLPTEIPLEPGESPPPFRRRVGTAFQLPQNLINNIQNKEESIPAIELEMQVQANMAEAALGLANAPHVSKAIRRQHMAQYQQHKQQYNVLEEKLAFLKARVRIPQHANTVPSFSNQQLKHKKKPRPPLEQDDSVSMSGVVQNVVNPFGSTVFRHSGRYSYNPYIVEAGNSMEMRYNTVAYRGAPDSISYAGEHLRQEEILGSNLHRMNINSYKDRRGSGSSNNSIHTATAYSHSHSNPNIYQNQHSPQQPYPNAISCNTLPPQFRSPQPQQQQQQQQPPLAKSHPNLMFPLMGQHQIQQQPYEVTGSRSEVKSHQFYPSHPLPPTSYTHTMVESPVPAFNPHQIQPHQQYEHDVMTSGGLGGYWKQSENGETIWCTAMPNIETTNVWQRDKRFGSLDRRKGRRMHKRASPQTEPKPAISVPSPNQTYHENVRPVSSVKHRQTTPRNRQENRQLVRTQSLGSVGVQTLDSGWPSDDNSSCNSEAPTMNELNAAARKLKQKEWYETSLDAPPPPAQPPTRNRINSINLSEDIYVAPSPPVPKPPLEIPAESNPTTPMSPVSEELFNNNVPMNCTIVQAGQCKPYHEETKPFEMSDFYKYSTKFRDRNKENSKQATAGTESAVAQDFGGGVAKSGPLSPNSPSVTQQMWINNGNVVEVADEGTTLKPIQKVVYQPLQPMKCQPLSPPSNLNNSLVGSPLTGNTSLDLSQLKTNVAENFSAEMNAWYKSKEQQVDNNNSVERSPNSHSTATLV